jgi:hypothetical protein
VSSRSGTQTSALELDLAKLVRPSMKFVVQSSGLSITKKYSSARVMASKKRVPCTSSGGSNAAPNSARALDLFDSGSSSSNGEAVPRAPP